MKTSFYLPVAVAMAGALLFISCKPAAEPVATAAPQTAPADAKFDLTGKVTLKGTPPPEQAVQMAGDPKCGAAHTTPVTTRHFVVGSDQGLANVFVYVKAGAEGKDFTASTNSPLLDQVGCLYEPYVLGVMTNQEITIRNSDPTLHNVHATPKINKEFNFAQALKGQVNKKKFSEPEVLVRLKCDVHNWMYAYVGVVPHPYFAVTDKEGNFKIANLPPGKYTVEAYHLKAGAQTQDITVTAAPVKSNFALEVKPAQP